ncbi:chymotrypsin inhibitor-like [Harpegnathos saltator]|uniref:chymotrypsin inhibitor-like n=1 Tax=Harpegnathos saltator TaxID=610380 RepID=UPI00058F5E0D|nr:chymotrypsin inhibitor-like [Harpegnathos saltator]
MSCASLVLLVAIAVLFSKPTSQNPLQCAENQEWIACGTACVRTCATDSAPCTMQCGCQCKQEYVLNSSGECVAPENC